MGVVAVSVLSEDNSDEAEKEAVRQVKAKFEIMRLQSTVSQLRKQLEDTKPIGVTEAVAMIDKLLENPDFSELNHRVMAILSKETTSKKEKYIQAKELLAEKYAQQFFSFCAENPQKDTPKRKKYKPFYPSQGQMVATYRDRDMYYTVRPYATNLLTGAQYNSNEYWTVREWTGEMSGLVKDLKGRRIGE